VLGRGKDGESGFTLIELLLAIVMLGIIIIPVTGMVIAYFRDTTQTTLRLNESHDAQVVGTYWEQDVASIGVRGAFDSTQQTFPLQQSVNTSFGCAVPSGVSAPFVVLAWNTFDASGNATLINVGYATASSGTQLVRLLCAAGTLLSNKVIAKDLNATPTVACAGTAGSSCIGNGASVPAKVTLSLAIRDPADTTSPYSVALDGQRRQST
jgi:prepilin-type N-terminal cleavage/methylation domain-containing protein